MENGTLSAGGFYSQPPLSPMSAVAPVPSFTPAPTSQVANFGQSDDLQVGSAHHLPEFAPPAAVAPPALAEAPAPATEAEAPVADPEDDAVENGATPSLERMLLKFGLVTSPQLTEAMAEEQATGRPLWEIVQQRGWVSREDLVRLAERTTAPRAAAPAPQPEPVQPVAPPQPEPVAEVAPTTPEPVAEPEPAPVAVSATPLAPVPAPEPIVFEPAAAVPAPFEPAPSEPAAEPAPVMTFTPPAPVQPAPEIAAVEEEPAPVVELQPFAPELDAAPQAEPELEPLPAPAAPPVIAVVPEPEPVVPDATESVVPDATEPVVAVVPELAPDPEPEWVSTPEPEPVYTPEPVSALETESVVEPAALAPAAVPAVPAAEPGTAFRVVLRLANGERIEAHVCAGAAAARRHAEDLVGGLAAGLEKWPYFSGRFVRPESIVSVDVEAAL